MRSPRLICFGDLCVDLIAAVADLPNCGQDVTIQNLQITPGGAALSCAVAAAGHGADVELLGIVGNDILGEMLKAHLVNAGIGVSHIQQAAGQTGIVISTVQANGERTLYSYRGVNAEPYRVLPSSVRNGDCVYVSGYSCQSEFSRHAVVNLLTLARAEGVFSALDPSFQFARDVRREYPHILSAVEYILPNREEAALIAGREPLVECAAVLHELGIPNVIIKLGNMGCYVHTKELEAVVPVDPLEAALDTTGAGDVFCGVFLASILSGAGVLEAAQRANAAARSSALRWGGIQ